MNIGFESGYNYFQKSAGAILGSFDGSDYITKIDDEISKLEQDINKFYGYKTSSQVLKGDMAEYWHADTFNIKAVLNGSRHRATVDRSHGFGSVDVSTNFGDKYGLKYYSSAAESAKQQSKSVFERFKEYQSRGGKDTLEKYLKDRNYDSDAVINDPVYQGQIRVIPSDQLKDATEWLERKIATESLKRPEQVKRYKETLDLLRDKISDNKNKSIPLSNEESEKLAQLAKEAKFKAEDFGIEVSELLNAELVLKQSLKAGTNAAVISLALKVAPEIFSAIDSLIKNGEIDEDQFKQIGFAAISGGAEGFIRGSVASALTTCCKGGLLGEGLKEIEPSVISAVTVIAMNTIIGAYQVVQGKKSRTELSNEIVRDIFLTTSSMTAGAIGQAVVPIPVLGYMLGSFVGSVVGTFIYNGAQQATMTFCAETGITMFGLVEQDYKLPEDIIKDIGLETFDYESFEPDIFEVDSFEIETFDFDTIQPDNIGIKFLSRGVIGVSKIGYVE
jgi:hypothetical protein